MFFKLLLLFTIIPAIELYVLLLVGSHIGLLNTIVIIILTGIVGATFAKQQGMQIIFNIKTEINRGQIPGRELAEGMLVLVGGVLLLTPGFITDLLGFSLLLPVSRKVYLRFVFSYFKNKLQTKSVTDPTNYPFNNDNDAEDLLINRPEIDD